MKKPVLILFTLLCGNLHAQTAQTLVINELMQSNIENLMDDIKEFPDSWVELYNPTAAAINLKDYKIGIKKKEKKAWQLPDKTIAAGGYAIIYCDKEGKEDNRLHTDFRLESGDGCQVYLFTNKELVDSLPQAINQMPAPDIAYGRKTDGGDEWGYQLMPTAGKTNCGETTMNILGVPVFNIKGQVYESSKRIKLNISLPEGAPEGTVIRYTTDGSEPTAQSPVYSPFFVEKTTVIRAKLFCDGWLSPVSTAQSYIFHPRAMTTPIFSVQTDDRYLNDSKIGLFANNNSKEDKKTHDWRRPVNIECFTSAGTECTFNQLSETRIQGGQSRTNALKSMVFYANKRFDPDHKRFSYEFFPDQKPGVTEFKSFSLRDGGNDFSDLYFRDAIIQRTMASNVESMDWQACRTAVLYINGEYMGMLNIRERSNADNIFSNYDGLEDIDMVEISHEKINNVDMFEEELKEGTSNFYEDFKTFYSEKGHTLAEYEEWMDVNEFLDIIIMNLFYGNIDWPGNNTVFWRPNDDDTETELPKKWRVIVKDTDFGLGLYSRQNDYNTIDLLYNPSKYPNDNWAFSEPATRLIKNMLEDPDIRKLFIDKCCVYMGDFLNGKGTGKTIDLIKNEAMEEFVAHRDKYNPGWGWWPADNRNEITNKFNDAKNWASGRPANFYKFIGNQWSLGSPVALTVNKNNLDVDIVMNGIKLSENTFDGKFFPNRTITLSGTVPEEGKAVVGWKVTGKVTKDIQGSELSLQMPNGTIAINPVIGDATDIDIVENSTHNRQPSTLYDLMGNKVTTPKAGRIYLQNGKKIVWR